MLSSRQNRGGGTGREAVGGTPVGDRQKRGPRQMGQEREDMTIEQLADAVLDDYERTTMGCLGGRYDDINHVRGVRVGPLLKRIEDAIRSGIAAELERCAKIAETQYSANWHWHYKSAGNVIAARIREQKED